MEFELWWLLLLPAFFAAGWYAARWDLRQTIRASRQLPATYFKGLNHLLRDETEAATDSLTEVVKLDPDTPELHFALGSLYRRRGETDRAIRIHQALLDRRDLSQDQRENARLELGLDFMKAGLLDQAEASLAPLEGTRLAVQAEEQRIIIAQTTRAWKLAASIAGQLRQAGHSKFSKNEMHYWCSHAESLLCKLDLNGEATDELSQASSDEIQSSLAAAEAVVPNHPRVALLRLQLLQAKGDLTLKALEEFAKQHATHAALICDRYVRLATQQGQLVRATEQLKTWYEASPSQDLLLALIGVQNPVEPWVEQAIAAKPSSRIIEGWLRQRASAEAASSGILAQLLAQLKGLNAKAGRFQCKSCGFQASQHYWQCPGCSQWETYSPVTES